MRRFRDFMNGQFNLAGNILFMSMVQTTDIYDTYMYVYTYIHITQLAKTCENLNVEYSGLEMEISNI